MFDVASLEKGCPCRKYNCINCCLETEMNLTRDDISRIEDAGYKTTDFVVFREGESYLRNVNGRCFFLTNSGCSIYYLKPEGCCLYPLVYDEKNNSIYKDPFCPHKEEFKTEKRDIQKMFKILKKLYEEKA
jgi:Fe-S-cluster containining protein